MKNNGTSATNKNNDQMRACMEIEAKTGKRAETTTEDSSPK